MKNIVALLAANFLLAQAKDQTTHSFKLTKVRMEVDL